MNFNNLLCHIVKTLLRKYKLALDGVTTTKIPFEEFSTVLDLDKLKAWSEEAEKADEERGQALDIYALQMDKGLLFFNL